MCISVLVHVIEKLVYSVYGSAGHHYHACAQWNLHVHICMQQLKGSRGLLLSIIMDYACQHNGSW